MRKHYLFLFTIATIFATSCNDSDKYALNLDNEVTVSKPQYTAEFPKDDGSSNLLSLYNAPMDLYNGGPKSLRDILNKVGPSIANKLYNMNITEAEYNEIKEFTNALTSECSDDASKYSTIFDYVYGNTIYATSDTVNNDPYPVFKYKTAVCQGYSNLLHVMLHSQEIPCINVNGYMMGMGHAWNYVYYNNNWYVSDPTNDRTYTMSDINSYYGYAPIMMDAVIYEDENFVYGYKYSHIAVTEVKSDGEQLIIPYSVEGFTVTSFDPDTIYHDGIRELYVGKNINTFGEYGALWSTFAPNIENVYVDPENTIMESYSNIVYRDKEVYYVAPSARVVELKPAEYYGKETIKDLPNLEIVIFPKGTVTIGSWAIEKCPNLKTIYVPEGVTIEDNAFSEINEDYVIIEGEYTNIPQIKM